MWSYSLTQTEMARWIKCLLCKSDDQSLDPLNGCKVGQACWLPVVPACRRQRIPGTNSLATASQLVSSGLD